MRQRNSSIQVFGQSNSSRIHLPRRQMINIASNLPKHLVPMATTGLVTKDHVMATKTVMVTTRTVVMVATITSRTTITRKMETRPIIIVMARKTKMPMVMAMVATPTINNPTVRDCITYTGSLWLQSQSLWNPGWRQT